MRRCRGRPYFQRGKREKSVIRVARSQLETPGPLVATLAHELAHELLLGGGLLDETVDDHEWVTDLLPVYLGLGVFTANATIVEQYVSYGQVSWWAMGKQGYLPSWMLGYALALFALMRGEANPPWARHLRHDAASSLHEGLRYLRKSGDCLFHPDSFTAARAALTAPEALARLGSKSATVRLATLWEIEEQHLTGPECLEAVTAGLDDRDPSVAGDAARALASFGAAAAPAFPRLCQALGAADGAVRAGAAFALGALGIQPEAAAAELCLLLGDSEPLAFREAALALGKLGKPVDRRSLRHLLAGLEAALEKPDDAMAAVLIQSLLGAAERPEECIDEYFANGNTELAGIAKEELARERKFRAAEAETAPAAQQAP
jgi:hypothetical protein